LKPFNIRFCPSYVRFFAVKTPRIVSIETFQHSVGWIEWVFVKIRSDDGEEGWGEASLHGPVAPVIEAIRAYAEHLIGQEATEPESHWYRLHNAWRWRGGAVFMTAMSAIDVALWDMEARRLGVPLYRLLGGAHRKELRLYASHWLQDVKTAQEAFDGAREAVRRGFLGFKFCPFSFERMRNDPFGAIRHTSEIMAAAREGAGPETEIYIECGELLSPRTAPAMLKALEPHRPAWIEEPFPFEGPHAIARLQSETDIPVAVGERLLSRSEFRELLEKGGCRVVQPDVMHGGGITELRKIAALAEVYQVTVAPHNPGGPLCMAASMHFAASIPNFLVLEQIEPDRALRDAASEPAPILRNGYIELSDAPGLGMRPNLDALKDYPAGKTPRKERAGSLFH
jgi:galactonate dehydratase